MDRVSKIGKTNVLTRQEKIDRRMNKRGASRLVWLSLTALMLLILLAGCAGGNGVTYRNAALGFEIDLPQDWEGFTIIEATWEGDALAGKDVDWLDRSGQEILLRHPNATQASPMQDIPVLVFTLAQWDAMTKLDADFHIGAAPINPAELGRNNVYVFGLPARYNFGELPGREEVDQIITGGNFSAFDVNE
jgi:hypothetical protein